MARFCAAGLLAAAFALPALAQSDKPAAGASYTEVGVGHLHENVSNQPNDWSDTQFELLHKFADRKLVLGKLGSVSRFGLRDTTASLAGYYPLGARTTLYAEGGASSGHFLARDTVHLQLAQNLGGGWGAIGGLKHLRYSTTTVDVADLTVEYYFSSFRAAVTALPAHSSTAGSASTLRLQLGYYYGKENNVQIVAATGDEVDKPVATGAILRTSVRSTAVYGRHFLTQDWALTYTLGRTHQGDSRRDAIGIGLRYRF